MNSDAVKKYCCKWDNDRKEPDSNDSMTDSFYMQLVKKVAYQLQTIILSPILKEKKKNGTKYCTLQGRKVEECFVTFFLVMAILILFCAISTAWSMMIIRESFTCDPALNCYAFHKEKHFDIDIISDNPIENCSQYDNNNTVITICYEIVFNVPEGFSVFGGLIAFATLAINIMIALMYTLYDCCTCICTFNSDKKVCVIVMFCLFVPLILLLHISAILVLTLDKFSMDHFTPLFKTNYEIYNAVFYGFSSLYSMECTVIVVTRVLWKELNDTQDVEAAIQETAIQRGEEAAIQRGEEAAIQREEEAAIQRGEETAIQRGEEAAIQREEEAAIQREEEAAIPHESIQLTTSNETSWLLADQRKMDREHRV